MYYKTNALYEYLRKMGITKFEFVSGNLWQLVYGDGVNPRLLVVVSGRESRGIEASLSTEEQNAYSRMCSISTLTQTPVIFIRFAIDQDVDSVYLYMGNNKFTIKTMEDLTLIFSAHKLPTKKGATGKYLNDKESSAYHKWQRKTLGSQLVVSDIDLIRIDPDTNSIIEIYELKRSFIALDRWEPYNDDYNNFRLLGNLLNNSGIPLKIAYNVRTTNPWNDNISTLKLFNVNVNKQSLIEYDRTINLDDFLNHQTSNLKVGGSNPSRPANFED